MENSELYEMRVSIGNNEHRSLLFAIDNISFIECTQAVLLNSFLKKDNKQYRKEIIRAKEILKRYSL
ncbi:MAG: addiction module toxin RelE [Proteiniphilum sp.]|nr:type II toxin-antitoxin system RelE/ParE family toxin [Proteiniphilum sp.]